MSKDRFLGYGRQLIDDEDVAAVTKVLRGDYLTQGPVVERFEHALAERVGAKYAVAVNSGTAALHIACLATGLKPGQAGITSALTFIASANAIVYSGADVALADIDRDALGISGKTVSEALKNKQSCKVVIPVHFAGLAFDSSELRKVAGNRVIIEDACHSLGGSYADGKPVGSCAYADMSTFSFHPVKSITTGEGGAITTNNEDTYKTLLRLRNHGIERDASKFENSGESDPWYYEQQELGFNYRMSDIQAALGMSQLARLDNFVSRRREIATHYDKAFADLNNVRIAQSAPIYRARSSHHLYTVCINYNALGTTRAVIMERLRESKIGSQVHYIPVYKHPFYQKRDIGKASDFPVTEDHYNECLSLPIHTGLSDEEVERVVDAFCRAVA